MNRPSTDGATVVELCAIAPRLLNPQHSLDLGNSCSFHYELRAVVGNFSRLSPLDAHTQHLGAALLVGVVAGGVRVVDFAMTLSSIEP